MIDKAIAAAVVAVVVFAGGFATAWTWQEGKHDDYVREQEQDLAAREAEASKQRDKTAAAWAENVAALHTRLGTKQGQVDAFARCIAAGRCSPDLRDRMLRNCPKGEPVPPAGGVDEASPDPIPATGSGAEGLVLDCSVTTLQLNSLQADIEKQKGY